jgi:hypothetical protein
LSIGFHDSGAATIVKGIFNGVRFQDESRIISQVHVTPSTKYCRTRLPSFSKGRRQSSTTWTTEIRKKDVVINSLEGCPVGAVVQGKIHGSKISPSKIKESNSCEAIKVKGRRSIFEGIAFVVDSNPRKGLTLMNEEVEDM